MKLLNECLSSFLFHDIRLAVCISDVGCRVSILHATVTMAAAAAAAVVAKEGTQQQHTQGAGRAALGRASVRRRGRPHAMQGRGRLTIDPGTPTTPGRSTYFHRPGGGSDAPKKNTD